MIRKKSNKYASALHVCVDLCSPLKSLLFPHFCSQDAVWTLVCGIGSFKWCQRLPPPPGSSPSILHIRWLTCSKAHGLHWVLWAAAGSALTEAQFPDVQVKGHSHGLYAPRAWPLSSQCLCFLMSYNLAVKVEWDISRKKRPRPFFQHLVQNPDHPLRLFQDLIGQ